LFQLALFREEALPLIKEREKLCDRLRFNLSFAERQACGLSQKCKCQRINFNNSSEIMPHRQQLEEEGEEDRKS